MTHDPNHDHRYNRGGPSGITMLLVLAGFIAVAAVLFSMPRTEVPPTTIVEKNSKTTAK